MTQTLDQARFHHLMMGAANLDDYSIQHLTSEGWFPAGTTDEAIIDFAIEAGFGDE